MVSEFRSRLSKAIVAQRKYYFTRCGFSIGGISFVHALVEYSFLGFLIQLLESKMENYTLRIAAAISIGQDFSTALMDGILTCVGSSRHIHSLWVISITEACFCLGIGLTAWFFPTWHFGELCIALAPLALGSAGQGFIKIVFLHILTGEKMKNDEKQRGLDVSAGNIEHAHQTLQDLFKLDTQNEENGDPPQWDKKVEDLFHAWRFVGRSGGALVAILLSTIPEYYFPLTNTLKLTFSASVLNFCLFLAHMKHFRRLEKLASGRLLSEENNDARNPDDDDTKTKEQCLRQFLKVCPLLIPFLIYYMVEAAGSTFFIEQLDKLDPSVAIKLRIPSLDFFFYGLRKTVSFVISSLIDKIVIEKLFKHSDKAKKRVRLIRIIVGMLVCFCCCVVSWYVESRRLKLIHQFQGSDIIPMGVSWLVPQFFLFGMTGGLVGEGLEDFFKTLFQNVFGDSEESGQYLEIATMVCTSFVDAAGKLLSVVFVLCFQSWIRDGINSSRVNNYYFLLAILTLGSLLFFIGLYIFYDSMLKKKEDDN